MGKKHIHINQHKIKSNLKHKTNEPVITVKMGKQIKLGPIKPKIFFQT